MKKRAEKGEKGRNREGKREESENTEERGGKVKT